MKLIKPSVEYIPQEESKIPYKHIERCARTCYKSENKITVDSAKKFVDGLIMAGHLAMLEHGTIYLFYSGCCYDHKDMEFASKYENNPYTQGGFIGTDDNEMSSDGEFYDIMGNHAIGNMQFCFTTNMRVLVENNWLGDIQYACKPTEYHKKRYTMKFICDRSVSHELVRQRKFSFAQESQRYCNYSKEKFNNELTYIIPSWYDGSEEEANALVGGIAAGLTLKKEAEPWAYWLTSLVTAQGVYFDLLNEGWPPQQARSVLPNATKTEIVMTGFENDWEHFFDLRLRGTTGKPHPDMQHVAQLAWNEFKDKLNLEL